MIKVKDENVTTNKEIQERNKMKYKTRQIFIVNRVKKLVSINELLTPPNTKDEYIFHPTKCPKCASKFSRAEAVDGKFRLSSCYPIYYYWWCLKCGWEYGMIGNGVSW